MAEEKKNSGTSRMFFSGFASSIAGLATYPLEVIKIKEEIQKSTGITVVKENFKKKGFAGTFKEFYKGVMGSTARSLVQSSLRFELYEEAKRRGMVNSLEEKLIVASGCGAIAGVLVTPTAKVIIRGQNNPWFAYKSVFDGLKRIYSKRAFHTAFVGAEVSALRGMMNSIGQFVLYDEAKEVLLRNPELFKDDVYTSVLASISAGSVATLLQQPLEVVQATFFNATPGKFQNSADVFKNIARNYGIRGFYKGLLPSFVRIVPQTVITYLILEYLRENYGLQGIYKSDYYD